jgi:hypothetical protein
VLAAVNWIYGTSNRGYTWPSSPWTSSRLKSIYRSWFNLDSRGQIQSIWSMNCELGQQSRWSPPISPLFDSAWLHAFKLTNAYKELMSTSSGPVQLPFLDPCSSWGRLDFIKLSEIKPTRAIKCQFIWLSYINYVISAMKLIEPASWICYQQPELYTLGLTTPCFRPWVLSAAGISGI